MNEHKHDIENMNIHLFILGIIRYKSSHLMHIRETYPYSHNNLILLTLKEYSTS